MPAPIRISPSEWEVLNIVWDRAPVTASAVFQALAGERDWHPKTVNTFLTRLVQKGILRSKREGKASVYAPRVTRERCIREESDSFLRRVFRGALAPMMLHFVERSDLSPADIEELERLLAQKKSRKK